MTDQNFKLEEADSYKGLLDPCVDLVVILDETSSAAGYFIFSYEGEDWGKGDVSLDKLMRGDQKDPKHTVTVTAIGPLLREFYKGSLMGELYKVVGGCGVLENPRLKGWVTYMEYFVTQYFNFNWVMTGQVAQGRHPIPTFPENWHPDLLKESWEDTDRATSLDLFPLSTDKVEFATINRGHPQLSYDWTGRMIGQVNLHCYDAVDYYSFEP